MISIVNIFIFIINVIIVILHFTIYVYDQYILINQVRLQDQALLLSEQLVPTVPSIPTFIIQQKKIDDYEAPVTPMLHERHYDWNKSIQPMINKILQIRNIYSKSTLLIESVNNCTNGSLNLSEATAIIYNLLVNNKIFIPISIKTLSIAKKKLGLLPQDNLNLIDKSIAIAHNIGAQYILCSSVIGNINTPILRMQLILVKTGEIIWLDKNVIWQQE